MDEKFTVSTRCICARGFLGLGVLQKGFTFADRPVKELSIEKHHYYHFLALLDYLYYFD